MSAFYIFMYIVSFLFLLLAAVALLLTPIMFITFIIMLCRKKKGKIAVGIISIILPNLILPLLVLFFVTFPTTWCNHQYEIIEQVEATCTEKGFIKKLCQKCDAAEEEEIEALSHSFVVEKTEEATCSHPKQVYKKCK